MEYQERIIYEQPTNEAMRICLRFEHLHQQAHFFSHGSSQWESRACMMAMLDMLNLLDRPDLRNKYTQEVSRILNTMKRLKDSPNIDATALNGILKQLDTVTNILQNSKGKFADSLRNNEFMKVLAQVNTSAGGTCPYNAGSFQLWLDSTHAQRQQQLASWLDEFTNVQTMTEILLKLIRESTVATEQLAQSGFYQGNLDPQAATQLIRVEVATATKVFPKISIGRHGLSVRFFEQNLTDRASQIQRDVQFSLACCVL